MRIGLIAIDGCFGSAIASIIDIVRVADGARGDVDPRIDPIELAILGPKRRVTTTASMTLSVDHPLSESGEFDVVVVPALQELRPQEPTGRRPPMMHPSGLGDGEHAGARRGDPGGRLVEAPERGDDRTNIIGGRRPVGSWGRSS